MPHATTHRILFIDAYDSFTNNIIALLETNLHVQVTTIKIDEPIPNFPEFLNPFSAVVAGPGPGDPRNPKDVGRIQELWKLEKQDVLPVLGICLGFQSLVLAFGGKVDRLGEPRHGVVRRVRGSGEGMFRGVEDVETVQYHSLYASLGPHGKYDGTGFYDAKNSVFKCSDLTPLAWDYEVDNAGDRIEETVPLNPRRVLMAVEHKSKPFFGIQFHAESICSNSNARKVIEAWWEIAKKWRRPPRDIGSLPSSPRWFGADSRAVQIDSRDVQPLQKYRRAADNSKNPPISFDEIRNGAKTNSNLQEDLKKRNGVHLAQTRNRKCEIRVVTQVVNVGEATVPLICETLGLTDEEAVILDSEMHQRRDVGEHSIIGLVSPNSLGLEYRIGTSEVRRIHKGQNETIDLRLYGGSVFSYLKTFMGQYKVESSNTGVPFWGGLMGFISYEACLETIGISHSQTCTRKDFQRPDLSFVFVERSIVVDHFHQNIHVQTIKPDDQDWVDKTISLLQSTRPTPSLPTTPKRLYFNAQMSLPDAANYQSKVRACQSAIRAGDSYELCLTNQATIHTQNRLATWPLYLRLRNLNPAPFSAYVRLGKLTLLSSSPERFLRWSRPTKPSCSSTCTNDAFNTEERTINCQFRPIKGTVKRQPHPNLPPLTLAEATALLATPKERAENLMIVDLIRHDLHGVVGSGRVTVPKLMVVEEYAMLFQLVSVIEGSLTVQNNNNNDDSNNINRSNEDDNTLPTSNPPDHPSTANTTNNPNPKTGIDILAASLPPGSMTGAPKLRSCQILRSLEPRPRGAYSGVLGYMDVGGGGDFSVVIRSAVRWDRDGGPGGEANGGEKGEVVVVGDEGIVGDGDGDADAEEEDDDDEEVAGGDEWTIGAGGAVTGLSSEEGEWEEMLAKLRSTLRLFEDDEAMEGGGEGGSK